MTVTGRGVVFGIFLLLTLHGLTSISYGATEVTVKSAGIDFIHNLLADVDAISQLKGVDNYDHKRDIATTCRINSIFTDKQLSIRNRRSDLIDTCNSLIKAKGPDFSAQLSVIILDAVKVAFGKQFDPLGQAVKQGVKQAEYEIPRSSFQIRATPRHDASMGSLVDSLYAAQTETRVQDRYSILVVFISSLVNKAKLSRNIALEHDDVLLNKLGFGSTVKPVSQVVKKKGNREITPIPGAKDSAETSVNTAVTKAVSPAGLKGVEAKKEGLSDPGKVAGAVAPQPVILQRQIVAAPVVTPVQEETRNVGRKVEDVSPPPKTVPPSSKAVIVDSGPAAADAPVAVAVEQRQPPVVHDSGSLTARDTAAKAIRLKPRKEFGDVDECVQSNIGIVVSLSDGYGTMDVLAVTKYLCEGIFLCEKAPRQSSAGYSGYTDCVERNIGAGSDGFVSLKQALGRCDGLFGISR